MSGFKFLIIHRLTASLLGNQRQNIILGVRLGWATTEESFEPHNRTVRKEKEICATQGIQCGCKNPKIIFCVVKWTKDAGEEATFYSHAAQRHHKPNPTPCASLICLIQTRIQPSSDVTLHAFAALSGQELVARKKWDANLH
ncbi:hypothetical protein SADUNF_Sadunf09G0023300 [Salix dunnii]|uniref:Uncharacterized protein n=1 Tax=Salix dunnii TaxID=1413687 RepID=A0A835MQN0_9ROSI|nr:hypothetical protein SADUNF_Sadunf09G0023300 [Salix dunnii]